MTQITDSLIKEHSLILRMLSSLNHSIDSLEKGEPVDINVFHKSIDFFKNFVEIYHHSKEEDFLFELMHDKINSSDNGLIKMLAKEHQLGRSYMNKFEEAVARLEQGYSSAQADIIENGRKFSLLFAHHIHKENNILYELANQTLSIDDKRYLATEFNEKLTEFGTKEYYKFQDMIEELAPESAIGSSEEADLVSLENRESLN
jgi:hemerythrin-like domain-containing protein